MATLTGVRQHCQSVKRLHTELIQCVYLSNFVYLVPANKLLIHGGYKHFDFSIHKLTLGAFLLFYITSSCLSSAAGQLRPLANDLLELVVFTCTLTCSQPTRG